MESMHEALLKRMDKFGLAKAITATVILESVNRVLPEGVIAKTYKNGVVTVHIGTSAEAYFFKQEQDVYLERMQAALPEAKIEKIRIWVNHTKGVA